MGRPLLAILLLAVLSSSARADSAGPPPVPAPTTRDTGISAVAGLGTPVGVLGVEVERRLVDGLWLAGGVGIGLSGLQVAVMPRYEFGNRVVRAALGLGMSGGRYEWNEIWCFDDSCATRRHDRAMWANAEFSVVTRLRRGVRLRGFVGYGLMLNDASFECVPRDAIDDESEAHCLADHQDDGERLPWIGFSVGYAFE